MAQSQPETSNSARGPRFTVELVDREGNHVEAAGLEVIETMEGVTLMVHTAGEGRQYGIHIDDAVGAFLAGTLASSSGVVFG